MPIKNIKKSDIENFQIELEKDLMPATINFIIQQTSSIFNWSIENGFINSNPTTTMIRYSINSLFKFNLSVYFSFRFKR